MTIFSVTRYLISFPNVSSHEGMGGESWRRGVDGDGHVGEKANGVVTGHFLEDP